jgi:formylglycine-generating enzyme required for sulfatase activity
MSRRAVVAAVVGMIALGQAQAVDYPATVTVGDPNNVPDSSGYGSVSYKFEMGKYEVTQAEFAEFLNATAKSGRGWLPQMSRYGLSRSGSAGTYEYSLKADWAKRPAVLMNWHETLRFANWLTNGKGEGSTETGAYKFVDEWGEKTVKMPDHAALAAGGKVHWVLANEDEWVKAGYYDPEKDDGAGGYWPYPSPSDTPPKANLASGANTDVGKFTPSAYGTHDQGGNVWEWNETRQGANCGVRGGSYHFGDTVAYMGKGTRYCTNPTWFVFDNYGFRVAALGSGKKESKKDAKAEKTEE